MPFIRKVRVLFKTRLIDSEPIRARGIIVKYSILIAIIFAIVLTIHINIRLDYQPLLGSITSRCSGNEPALLPRTVCWTHGLAIVNYHQSDRNPFLNPEKRGDLLEAGGLTENLR